MTPAPDETARRTSAAGVDRVTAWLGLAATPVFAALALLTALSDTGGGMMCPALHAWPQLGGMAFMYSLMSVFHASPWLRCVRPARAAVV